MQATLINFTEHYSAVQLCYYGYYGTWHLCDLLLYYEKWNRSSVKGKWLEMLRQGSIALSKGFKGTYIYNCVCGFLLFFMNNCSVSHNSESMHTITARKEWLKSLGLLLIERGDRLSSPLQRQRLQSDLCVLYVYMVHLTQTWLQQPMKKWTRDNPNLWDVLCSWREFGLQNEWCCDGIWMHDHSLWKK